MKKLILSILVLISASAVAKIEDNSFLLEEAFNQEYGIYQFIQKYQMPTKNQTTYDYSFENEIPITDKTHQFSYSIPVTKTDPNVRSKIGDLGLSYRWQPVNRDGFLLAERFTLLTPTGSVADGTGSGVFGFEFMQAATMELSSKFMNHWNFGFSSTPNAKTSGIGFRRTISTFTAGSSLIYTGSDNFNIMFEALMESGQQLDTNGRKSSYTSVYLNPGLRWAIDLDWKDTQIVPGIGFPVDVINAPTVQTVLLYLSIEPKFY